MDIIRSLLIGSNNSYVLKLETDSPASVPVSPPLTEIGLAVYPSVYGYGVGFFFMMSSSLPLTLFICITLVCLGHWPPSKFSQNLSCSPACSNSRATGLVPLDNMDAEELFVCLCKSSCTVLVSIMQMIITISPSITPHMSFPYSVIVPVLSKQGKSIYPATFIMMRGEMQKIFFGINPWLANITTLVIAACKAGSTTIVIRSNIMKTLINDHPGHGIDHPHSGYALHASYELGIVLLKLKSPGGG